MAVYLITLFACFFLLCLSSYNKSSKSFNKIFIGISLIILVCVAAFRGSTVGTDYPMYNSFYYNSNVLPLFSSSLEFIFVFLCKFFNLFFASPWIMFGFIAFYMYYCVYKNSIKLTKYYELAIFLFLAFGFYTNSFNIVRQWMAIPLLYLGMYYINEKSYKKGVPIFIIGLLSHYTSIITIPFFFLCNRIKSNKTRILIVIISILFYLNLNSFMDFLYMLFLRLNFGPKYLKYFTNDIYNSLNTNVLVMPMFTLVTFIGYMIFSKKNIEVNKQENFLVNTTVFGFLTSLIGTKNVMFQRLQMYFVYSLIFVIPLIMEKIPQKIRPIVYILCILMGTLFYIYSLGKNGGEVLPYTTIFS